MTLQQLNDVIAIAETGSFNRAAERLYIAIMNWISWQSQMWQASI